MIISFSNNHRWIKIHDFGLHARTRVAADLHDAVLDVVNLWAGQDNASRRYRCIIPTGFRVDFLLGPWIRPDNACAYILTNARTT